MQVCTDGAARGNPGPAGAGAVLQSADGRVLGRVGRYLGHQTNNVAEYEAILLGLRAAQELGATEVRLVSDSELLIKQIKGVYRVKAAHLKPYHADVMRLARTFAAFEAVHVKREQNKAADQMANRAVDEELDGTLERTGL
ncbi:MAG: ribonuclease HI family protein [Deltaproteobacteria bacterium]|nr:ribonuclease HI family protein [Deltaproteobacteria bacterium]